ncbi:uncharacterized protein [Miscanthus floridulus]|uniref:uncharacterized protein n=1 Tax=Miscanthus floridulus TaxID=154761 RepID=UPI003459B2E8
MGTGQQLRADERRLCAFAWSRGRVAAINHIEQKLDTVQSRPSPRFAPARARSICVAPKTLAAAISPLRLTAVIASLLISPPRRVGGAYPDLWEVAFGHGDVVAGRGHGGAAVLACSEPRGRTGWGAAVLGFSRAQSRRREHEDLTWMASRGLGDGGQRQPGRPASSTSNLSTHALVAPRRLHPVPSPTASCSPAPSTPRPSPFPIPRRFFSILELHVPQMLCPAADKHRSLHIDSQQYCRRRRI